MRAHIWLVGVPAELPEPEPRTLGAMSQQAENWLLLVCTDAQYEAAMGATDALEAGNFEQLPITSSYLIDAVSAS